VGGVARRATIIRQERGKAQHTLVLDAGAALMTDRDPAKRTLGKSSVEAMNLMGYNAMALGLLDFAPLTLDELRERMAEAHFPMLSANAYISDTRELFAQPYVVLDIADHHVGILGLTDAGSTPYIVATDPLEAALKWMPELRSKADIIIVLSHAGLEADGEIAEKVLGIDVIVCGRNVPLTQPRVVGRTGTVLFHSDVAIVGEAGRKIGVAYLSFDSEGQLTKHDWRNVTLAPDIEADPEMNGWVLTQVAASLESSQ